MQIDPAAFKQARKRAQMTQGALAEESKVSLRTIQRIEKSEVPHSCRAHQVSALAKALLCTPDELAGKGASEKSIAEVLARAGMRQLKGFVRSEFRFRMDMVEKTYGVTKRDVIELAPLLFTLVAERSLHERREAVRQLEGSVEALRSPSGHPQLAFSNAFIGEYESAISAELQSIEAKDLFAQKVSEEALEYGEINHDRNPFVETVKRMARDCDNNILDPDYHGKRAAEWPLGIQLGLFSRQLTQIAGNNMLAIDALIGPEGASVSEIPERLLAEDQFDARVSWLADRISADRRVEITEWDLILNQGNTETAHSKEGGV